MRAAAFRLARADLFARPGQTALTAGQLAGLVLEPIAQTHGLEAFLGPCLTLFILHMREHQRQHDVF